MKMKIKMKETIALILAVMMVIGVMPMQVLATDVDSETPNTEPTVVTEATEEHSHSYENGVCTGCGLIQWDTDRLYNAIPVASGQLMPDDCSVVENDIYGYVVNYPLKKGHVLSISNTDYVFSVRKLANGNYSTLLKQATTDSFTATEDMTVAMLIRKPDKSALTAEELASIVIYDSQYGMIGVEGSVMRFTVEAETIDGGTATTRAAIFLPDSYTASGTSTPLIIMTNGGSAYLTESSWQGNTEANRNLVEFYLQNGYAVLVNDNTAGKVVNNASGMVPDLGCLQQLSGLMKSYEYVCNALNLERKFSIHARSQGTFVGIRIMREFPELVKCALITGPNVSAAHRWTVIANKDHTAKRFGFADLTGSTFEADKFVGNDIYTDMAAEDYSLPPTFWMESSNDVCPNNNKSIYEVVERLRELGCTAEYQKFGNLTHSETCRLASEEATAAALAFLEEYQECHTHSYTPAVTSPTCTEQGYTTYTCGCGDSYVDDYVDATGEHSYENGVCSGCGAEHPNLANYEGKVISILGDSISTFAGYIPTDDGFNLTHRTRYPDTSKIPDVTDVKQTWWMQVINQLDAKLGINDSWAGSTVYWGDNMAVQNTDTGEQATMASLTRIQNLGANGTPDVIFFYGGGNDMTKTVTVGTFDPANAPSNVDLKAKQWDTFADAYVATILRLKYYYPDAQIVALVQNPSARWTEAKRVKYTDVIEAVCKHYDIPHVILEDSGITLDNLPDGVHPDDEGMDFITNAVLEVLLDTCDVKPGEHIVHSVTHNLIGAESSLGYYKGVSDGKSFATNLTGENLTVTVTMGSKDITESSYSNGTISIDSVTGDVIITANGKEKTVYEDHLQQLPDAVCAGTNLWNALEPEHIYYTANGWGQSAVGTTHSVTFPVQTGDHIWATSFGLAGENGDKKNGTRITWFDENGVLKSLGRDVVYAEFSECGYITVPEGAVAVNIPMVSNANTWEIYILNRDHSYTPAVTAPTCTEQGYTTYTCACGDSYVDDYVNATGHSYGDWTITTAPTCTEKGSERRDCAACDHYETREVDATGHELTHHAAKAPTCTEIGWGTYETCSRCEYSTYEELPATGHSHTPTVTAPTCTEQGYTTYTCACGDSYASDYTDALGHSYGDWTTTIVPTCTEKGSERRDCAACDHYETRDVNATGHELAHHAAKAPTCTEIGWGAYETCSRCEYSTYEELPATGHSHTPTVTAPTCTEQGYTTYTCACGDSYVDDYVNATGHSYGEWTITTAPTCTEKGSERRDCAACDHYETREVDATGHSYSSVVTPPTDTDLGYTTHTCTVCGYSYVDGYTDTLCLLGDLNGDGEITAVDAAMTYSIVNGKLDATEAQLFAADVNGDGEITAVDAAMIYSYVNGKLAAFPAEK